MKKDIKYAFSLVEMLIVLGVSSIVFIMVIQGGFQLSRGVSQCQEMIKSKKELVMFCHGAYNFINNSFSAYLEDPSLSTVPPELDYRNTTFLDADPRQDVLFLVKDEIGNTGQLVYNDDPDNNAATDGGAFEWFSLPGATPQTMITDVYRVDSKWDSDGNLITSGVNAPKAPIFKFPHQEFLYNGTIGLPFRPKFVIIQFRKIIVPKRADNKIPITLPVTLMLEVNVSTYSTT